MCTLTWRPLPDGGYEAFFNRDELKTRQRALPPRRFDLGGSAVLAPVDADAGGTWISVNEYGVGICLLNHYQGVVSMPPSGAFTSRGLLVRALAHHRRIDHAAEALDDLPHAHYQPFRLLLLAVGDCPRLFTWDGATLRCEGQPSPPLISSGLDIEGATRNRTALYRAACDGGDASSETLLDYHRSHQPAPSPHSVCMHRDFAQTVSLTRMHIGARHVSLAYADGPPCSAALGEPLRLQRATAVA